jgi:pimeloyl-ACP methyl ester carboxylesterase
MGYVDIDGQPIHYDEYGSGELSVVWLHCFGGSARIWRSLIPLFPGFRSIAIDTRGHGRSAKSVDRPGEAGVGMRRLADDVYRLTEALGVSRFAVIGHSLGGGMALRLAVDHPESLRGIVSVSGFPAGGSPRVDTADQVLDAYLRGFRDPDVQRAAVSGGFTPGAKVDDLIDELVEDGLRVHEDFYLSWLRDGLAYSNFEEDLEAVRCPSTFLTGLRDANSPASGQLASAQKVPGARIVLLNEEGHYWPWENPDRFIAEVNFALAGFPRA